MNFFPPILDYYNRRSYSWTCKTKQLLGFWLFALENDKFGVFFGEI